MHFPQQEHKSAARPIEAKQQAIKITHLKVRLAVPKYEIL
jgi:hypothetical protein